MAKPTQKEIGALQNILLDWFQRNRRSFPWRKKKNTKYQIIISEILLQRTRAEVVQNFFPQFTSTFPGWKALNAASADNLEKVLKPLGLSKQRAIRLKALASQIEKNGGKLPSSRSDLESLPMMGQYIANAVELIIFHRRLPLLDVNMARVLERYFGPRKLADIRYDQYLQKLAFKVTNHENSLAINWAILDFAALVCKIKTPICSSCPLSIKCLYFNSLK
jgi:A/G-specific adenine glycosylase